jgi:photosystem II stability/assembly factor-like uncharacterized protein
VHSVVAVTPRVFVAAETGLVMSEDFGQTWKRLGLEGAVLSILPGRYLQADPTLLAGTRDGLVKSEDFGRTFHATALKGVEVRRMQWPGPALVLATNAGLYVSKDSGASVEALGAGLPTGDIRSMVLSSYFAMDPVLFVGLGEGGGLFISKDGGRSFRSAGLSGRTVYDLYWLGPLLYAATDGGVFRSESLGADWVALNDGFKGEARQLLFPLAPDQGSIIFVVSDQGLYRTSDGGNNWQFSTAFEEPIEVIATFPPPEPIVGAPKH